MAGLALLLSFGLVMAVVVFVVYCQENGLPDFLAHRHDHEHPHGHPLPNHYHPDVNRRLAAVESVTEMDDLALRVHGALLDERRQAVQRQLGGGYDD